MKYTKMLAAAASLVLLSASAANVQAAEAGNKPHTSTEPLFSVASVSKTFAAAAAMQLSDAGKLDIDRPVRDYLPEFTMRDSRYQDITVRMLMNHQSGLMGSYYRGDMLYGSRDRTVYDQFLSYLSAERLKAAPGAYGCYCNDGFELLELVVERVSGEDFTSYMENHICRPLGMEQTGTALNALETAEQVEVYSGRAKMPADYCMTFGEGGVLSTAPELCRFGSAFFKGDSTLLSEQAKSEMCRSYAHDEYEDGFGLGFDFVNIKEYQEAGVQVVSKGGDLAHQHAQLMVAPEEQISVAVLSAGGSSTYNQLLAQALMDIVLEEQGIRVHHPVVAEKHTLDAVPERYLAYAGLYLGGDGIYAVSFPGQKYLRAEQVCTDRPNVREFLYTDEDSFVEVSGKAETGNAVQNRSNQNVMRLQERNGEVFCLLESCTDYGTLGSASSASYIMQKAGENPVSEAAQAAWDARSGMLYCQVNEPPRSVMYNGQIFGQLFTDPAAPGYLGNMKITDETHAEAALSVPSSASRDQTDYEIVARDGTEYLHDIAHGGLYLPADCIPQLPAELDSVELTTGAAKWYNISGDNFRTITLDIPENAAVYVYDRFCNVIYTNICAQYGNTVTLPEQGMIVFAGETGSKVGIRS